MPELPEVETTKRKLEPLLIGKRILSFWTDWPRGLRISSAKEISKDIKNRKVLKLERKGKSILIDLDGSRALGFHQRMSGKILIVPPDLKDKHIHYRFPLSTGMDLILHDTRKFGVVWYGKREEVLKDKYFTSLGADPLVIAYPEFRELLSKRRGGIKANILKQDLISGVGNIIADESLWKAKIHPLKRIENFAEKDFKNLFMALRFILDKSIMLGGSTMRDWYHPDNTSGGYYAERYTYGRAGKKCQRCGSIIVKTKVAGRGTFVCPKCQK